jgi:lysozyme
MALWDDIAAAEADVAREEQELEAAKARLDALKASVVRGGPDVSSYQGDVDWVKVKNSGRDIVFPKVSDGDVIDPTFSAGRIASIKAAGLSYAPYYFARVASAGNSFRTPRAECAMAVYFATKQGWGKPGDLPLVYDIEDLNGATPAQVGAHTVAWVKAYEGLMGHKPIIYTAPGWWGQIASTLTADGKATVVGCPLWVAHWGVSAPTVPSPWTGWTFWQYTEVASVPGVTGPCDDNRANITRAGLDSLRIR